MGEQYRFEPTGEVRVPVPGEWYLRGIAPVLASPGFMSHIEYPIFRRVPHDPDTAALVACLTTRIKELESTLESIRDGYDHESDAHRYNNGACRKCMAAEALKGTA